MVKISFAFEVRSRTSRVHQQVLTQEFPLYTFSSSSFQQTRDRGLGFRTPGHQRSGEESVSRSSARVEETWRYRSEYFIRSNRSTGVYRKSLEFKALTRNSFTERPRVQEGCTLFFPLTIRCYHSHQQFGSSRPKLSKDVVDTPDF